MPRNDQITRQWHLLRQFDGSSGRTLEQLVEKENGRTRWRLMPGFVDIPALGFSATELMALLLSRNLLKPLEGTEIAASLSSALNKAATALPPQSHDYVRSMEQMFSVGLGPHKNYRRHRQTIDLISQAIDKRRTAQMRYFSASRNHTGRREVDPYYLGFAGGGLYLIGYCHLRKEVRMFAIERIRSITLTDHPYQMPLDFKVDEYVQDALNIMRSGRRIEVELLFSKKAAAWVKDKTWHPSQ
jgi:predicted DNA-binding transcriptional regulator YafY